MLNIESIDVSGEILLIAKYIQPRGDVEFADYASSAERIFLRHLREILPFLLTTTTVLSCSRMQPNMSSIEGQHIFLIEGLKT